MHLKKKLFVAKILTAVLLSGALLSSSSLLDAQSVQELRQNIQDRSTKIADLEKEIARYQAEMDKVSVQRMSLQNAIRNLDLSSKKLEADVELTENKIYNSEYKIRELELQIELQGQKMERNKEVIEMTLRKLNEAESESLLETMLASDDLMGFWDGLDSLERFKTSVRNNIEDLRKLREELSENKLVIQANVSHLEGLKTDLVSKYDAVEINKSEKDQLLAVTKNQEGEYQRILAEKKAKREAFLAELKAYESQLNFQIDKSKIPTSSPNTFVWPLDNVTITQYFGNTAFAQSGAYNGNGHNGIDMGTPIGTPVKSVLSGTVEAMGDTDTVCRNASYGKWILVRHNNGLSTLYAHLSGFAVGQGATVATGQVIGHSGNTGYSTGPHLHFTVYATEGVRVMQRPSAVCGGSYTMPVADLKAYLNPLDYLSR